MILHAKVSVFQFIISYSLKKMGKNTKSTFINLQDFPYYDNTELGAIPNCLRNALEKFAGDEAPTM